MERILINEVACPSNHFCPVTSMCPTGAIEQEGPFSAPIVNEDKCIVCKKCLKACPYNAFDINSN